MYAFVDLIVKSLHGGGSLSEKQGGLIVKSLHEGGHCSTNKGVSYTNLVSGLAVTLKLDYYYYYYNKGSYTLQWE